MAAIPAYISAGTGDIAGEWIVPERIPLTLLAILAAGISGYWIGWRLIDPKGDHDSLGALFLGAVICLLSYYLLGVMVGALCMVQKAVTKRLHFPWTYWSFLARRSNIVVDPAVYGPALLHSSHLVHVSRRLYCGLYSASATAGGGP